jgi:hypothetical protein
VTNAPRSSDLGGLLCPVTVGRERELGVLQGAWRAAGRLLASIIRPTPADGGVATEPVAMSGPGVGIESWA